MSADYAADADVRAAIAGELRLLEPAVRRDAEQVDALLHPDFFEFGASGRRWGRREIIEALAGEDRGAGAALVVTVAELDGRRLADGLVLVTYTSEGDQRRCRRSSIWRRTEAGWRVLFHQGTLIPCGPA
jgi:hypothetical protein